MRSHLIAAALLTAMTAPAGAVVIATGPYGAGSDTGGQAQAILGPGTYRFSFRTTAPVDFVSAQVTKTINTDITCTDPDSGAPFPCGGDNADETTDFTPVSPTLYQALLSVTAPYTITSGGQRFDMSETCCSFAWTITNLSGPAGLFELSYAAVPEPATWAMLAMGLFGAGMAIRRRPATPAHG